MTNSADPDQLASIYTVCNGRVYPGSAGLGLKAVYIHFAVIVLKFGTPIFLLKSLMLLFVLRFYSLVNPMGHVERGQLT